MEKKDKEFARYNEALELKKLGFDEACIGNFLHTKELKTYGGDITQLKNSELGSITAPIIQQAFRWFRKEHKLHSFVDVYPTPEQPERCWYMLRYLDREEGEDYMSGWFDDVEKAELGCLRKLIEVVKTKNKTFDTLNENPTRKK